MKKKSCLKYFLLLLLMTRFTLDMTSQALKVVNDSTQITYGCMKGDCKNGFGTETYKNGDLYIGNFKNGKRHGEGTYTYSGGNKYVGIFKDGMKHGYGSKTYNKGVWKINGRLYIGPWKFIGTWANDKKNGHGVIYSKDKYLFADNFLNNKFNRSDILYFKDFKITKKNNPTKTGKKTNSTREIKNNIVFGRIRKRNGLSGFWARKGDDLLRSAIKNNIRHSKLLSYNDLTDEPLYDDMFIYLEKKHRRGTFPYYKVKKGENLHSISQTTGVQLESLIIYNKLYYQAEPAVGKIIYLQKRRKYAPKLAK